MTVATARTRGGFSVILGNPPWERVKLQDQEFFAQRDPAVAGAPNASARKKAIAALKDTNPVLLKEFEDATRQAEGESHLLRSSGRYPLCGRGDINTYAVFAESMRDAISPTGRMGVIVPTGIATDDTTKFYFGDLVESRTLVSLFSFENEEFIFPGVHHSYNFSLLTVAGSTRGPQPIEFVFYARQLTDLANTTKRFQLSSDDIRLLNPNTKTCAVFRWSRGAEITKAIYRRVPVLIREACEESAEANPWGLSFLRMFDMSNASALFIAPDVACPALRAALSGLSRTDDDPSTVSDGPSTGTRAHSASAVDSASVAQPVRDLSYLPLYEAKMLHQFDHRWATYARDDCDWLTTPILTKINKEGKPEPDARDATTAEKGNPSAFVAPRYWVRPGEVESRLIETDKDGNVRWRWKREWLLGFRNIARVTDERTLIASVLPRTAVGHSAPLIFLASQDAKQASCLLAMLLSVSLDYVTRQKVGGVNMTFGYFQQFPVFPPSVFAAPCPWDEPQTLADWIAPRVLELVYTAHDLAGFARDLGYDGPPFQWDPARRAQIRAELDAAFFHLYGVSRDDAAYIMDTFLVFKARDEERNGGVYKTKRTILAIYDQMALAAAGGSAWQSLLSPLPGDPAAAHTFESLAAAGTPAIEPAPRRAPAIRTGEAADQQAAVIAAFLDVRQGRSPDYVVCEPGLNAAFIAAARDRGAIGDDAALNRTLLGARKTGVLSDHPTTSEYRMPKALVPYAFVAEWAARHLQRQELLRHDEPPSLDDILCDPSLAVQFDELAAKIRPGIKPLDIRWAALGFRKTARKAAAPGSVTVEPTERVDADAGLSQLPEKPGLYLIVAGQQVLYANYTRDLRDQLSRHAEVASGALAPEWLLPKQSRPDTVRWAWFQSLTPEAIAEARIHLVTEHRPWLNLLETGAA